MFTRITFRKLWNLQVFKVLSDRVWTEFSQVVEEIEIVVRITRICNSRYNGRIERILILYNQIFFVHKFGEKITIDYKFSLNVQLGNYAF